MSITYLHNEPELLKRISEGDENAFTKLFLHHRGKVYSTIYRLTESKVMAEEILQDVFMIIWMKREELGSIADFEAYLHTIARRATYRGLKQLAKEKKTVRSQTQDDEPAFHVTGESLLQLKQYSVLLQQAIDRLPAKQRETFMLIREEGYRRGEVAARLGVSPETVKYNLEEGLRKIRAYFMAHSDYLLVFVHLFVGAQNIFFHLPPQAELF